MDDTDTETVTCYACMDDRTPDEMIQCPSCSTELCSDCALVCQDCDASTCDTCGSHSDISDGWICHNCGTHCQLCEGWMSNDSSTYCEECDFTMCESCLETHSDGEEEDGLGSIDLTYPQIQWADDLPGPLIYERVAPLVAEVESDLYLSNTAEDTPPLYERVCNMHGFAPSEYSPVNMAADFYLLEAISSNVLALDLNRTETGSELTSILSEAADTYASHCITYARVVFAYLDMVIGGELRYHKGLRTSMRTSRHRAWLHWKLIRQRCGTAALDRAVELFNELGHQRGSVGGPLWATAAEVCAAYERRQMSDAQFLDRAWTLEHNGGCFFSKVRWAMPHGMEIDPEENAEVMAHSINMLLPTLFAAQSALRTNWQYLLALATPPIRKLFNEYLNAVNAANRARHRTPLRPARPLSINRLRRILSFNEEMEQRSIWSTGDPIWALPDPMLVTCFNQILAILAPFTGAPAPMPLVRDLFTEGVSSSHPYGVNNAGALVMTALVRLNFGYDTIDELIGHLDHVEYDRDVLVAWLRAGPPGSLRACGANEIIKTWREEQPCPSINEPTTTINVYTTKTTISGTTSATT